MARTKGKYVLVLLESMFGSGHKLARKRVRLDDKLQEYRYDPWVRQWGIYKEVKKIRTLKDK